MAYQIGMEPSFIQLLRSTNLNNLNLWGNMNDLNLWQDDYTGNLTLFHFVCAFFASQMRDYPRFRSGTKET